MSKQTFWNIRIEPVCKYTLGSLRWNGFGPQQQITGMTPSYFPQTTFSVHIFTHKFSVKHSGSVCSAPKSHGPGNNQDAAFDVSFCRYFSVESHKT